ncbi:hypothetical protein PGC35_20340 [Psychrobacillus sp. PGGUH221]
MTYILSMKTMILASTGITQGFAIGEKQAIGLVIYVFQEAFKMEA